MDEKRGSWVSMLRPDDRGRHDHACSEQTRQEFTERLGGTAVDWSGTAAREITSSVAAELPRFAAGVGERQALGKGIEGGVLCILASVRSGVVVDPATTQEVQQTAREFVQLGVPLPDVWASVRHAHWRLVDRLLQVCQELVPLSEQASELRHMFDLAYRCVDALVEGLGQAYAVESERWHATAASVREELVNAVLADAALDLDTVSQKLRYELRNRHHTALVVWQPGPIAPETTRLHDAALAWLEAHDAQQALLIPRGQSLLYAWGNRRSRFPVERKQFDGGVRVAVGSAGYDLVGFRDSHHEAHDAHRVALAMPGLTDTVVPFGGVSLLAMLSPDRTRLRQFVARELGALVANDPNTKELRRTLRTYLETRNAIATASQLVVARNTIAYRLRRAEEIRGMSIDERQLELWVALLLAEMMGADQ
jgi:sugar diacid utilization regulator